MHMDDKELLAETYLMLNTTRKDLIWKLANEEPEDEWLIQMGLSKGHAADLAAVEDRLFSEVMEPAVKRGVPIGSLIRALRTCTQPVHERPLSYPLLAEVDADRLVLLAKRYLDVDEAIWDVGVQMQEAEPITLEESRCIARTHLEEIKKLEEEQIEILYQFAMHGLGAADFRKAQEDYKGLSATAYQELVARVGE